MKIKSNAIIDKRNKLSKDITHYWLIIRRENIMSNKQMRNYDLAEILNHIKQKAEHRVSMKLFSQALNMGYTNFNEFKKDTNYESLFKLSELNEQLVQIGLIPTLNPATKASKGKKKMDLNEIFTSAKIRAMKKKIQIEINALNKKLEDFNNKTELEIDDSFGKLFAA